LSRLGLLGGLTRFCRCCSRLSLGGGPSARWDLGSGLARWLHCLAGLRGCGLSRSGLCRLRGFRGRLRGCRGRLSCLARCLRRLGRRRSARRGSLLRRARRLSVGAVLHRVLSLCRALSLLLRRRSGRRGGVGHGLGKKHKAGLIPGIGMVRTGARRS